jgi:hypothetical protein
MQMEGVVHRTAAACSVGWHNDSALFIHNRYFN